jgi:predicted ferric reductase
MDLLTWELIRSAGLLAYLMLSASVLMGMAVKSRVLDGLVNRPWVYELHQSLSIAALVTIVGHVAFVLLNAHVSFSPQEVLVPLASDWRPLATALGILSMYLVALLVLSTRLRARLGQKTWRTIHYSSFLAWVLAQVHSVAAGSDSDLGWIRIMYVVTTSAVFLLLFYRVLSAPERGRAASEAGS